MEFDEIQLGIIDLRQLVRNIHFLSQSYKGQDCGVLAAQDDPTANRCTKLVLVLTLATVF